MFIIDISIKRAARKIAGASSNRTVTVVETGSVPKLVGESYCYRTRGGRQIYHPSAYSKHGWSNMVYHGSSICVETPKAWIYQFLDNDPAFTKIMFGDRIIYTASKKAKRVEKVLSRYLMHYLNAPKERKETIFSAVCGLLWYGNNVLFAEQLNTKILDQIDAYQILGHSPKEISKLMGCELTHAEAAAWITKAYRSPKDYLVTSVTSQFLSSFKNDGVNFCAAPPSLTNSDSEVIRWALEVFKSNTRFSGLCASRFLVQDDHKFEFKFISRLDELKKEDLHNSVHKTFEAAAQRIVKQKLKKLKNETKPLRKDPEWWPGDNDNCKLLRSAADLIKEGDDLKHCVAQYIPHVKTGKSVIVALTTVDGDRSTVEIDPKDLTVRQHYSRSNSTPPNNNHDLLLSLISKLKEIHNGSDSAHAPR